MNEILFFVVFNALLLVCAIKDLKHREVSNTLTFGLIFLALGWILSLPNLDIHIFNGLALFGFGFLAFKTLEFGGADVKVLSGIGLLLPTQISLLIFLGFLGLFGGIYGLLYSKFHKNKKIPFIPLILLVFNAFFIILN